LIESAVQDQRTGVGTKREHQARNEQGTVNSGPGSLPIVPRHNWRGEDSQSRGGLQGHKKGGLSVIREVGEMERRRRWQKGLGLLSA